VNGGGAGLAQHQPALGLLLGLDLLDALRRRAAGNAAEVFLHALQRCVGVDVADNHQRRIRRHVVFPVVPVKILARHRLEIGQPADRRVVIGMDLERGRVHFDVEQLFGIVLAALQLGNNHAALRLEVRRIIEAAVHAFGLDEQHPVERVLRRRLEVRRLIDPGVAVPAAAELFDDALDLVARDVPGPLEVHVLAPVRHPGQARAFVLRADAVPAPHRRQRRRVHFLNEHFQTVIENCLFDHPRP